MWETIIVALVAGSVPALIAYFASSKEREQSKLFAADAKSEAAAARASVAQLETLNRVENRVRGQRTENFIPTVKVMGDLFNKGPGRTAKDQDSLTREMEKFWVHSIIYASDDSQRAFGRMMQGFFNDAPPAITMRLWSDFLLALRKDMGDEETSLTATDIWAPKLKDLFRPSKDMVGFDTLPLDELANKHSWKMPWAGTVLSHRRSEEARTP